MGHAMVQHIMEAGYEVRVWNRTKSKTDDLVEKGVIFCENIGELTKDSDIIFTIIGDPKNVEESYF
jgi:3-hydroxyisobutyrate dehydrogenase